MGFLYVIYNFVRPIAQNLMGSSSLISLLLGKKLGKIEEIPTKQESPFLTQYLDKPLLTTTDTSVKKAMAVAAAIAKKKGVESIKAKTPEELASTVDEGVTRMKVAYQVGKGILNSTAAAEEIIDRTASRLVSFTNKVIDKGMPIVAEKVITAVSSVCPPVAVVAPVIRAAVPFVSKVVKKVVNKGIEVAATIAKRTVQTVIKSVKKVGKKIFKFIFG